MSGSLSLPSAVDPIAYDGLCALLLSVLPQTYTHPIDLRAMSCDFLPVCGADPSCEAHFSEAAFGVIRCQI